MLAAPERTCPGYGIVRLAAPMATTEASIDREKPCRDCSVARDGVAVSFRPIEGEIGPFLQPGVGVL